MPTVTEWLDKNSKPAKKYFHFKSNLFILLATHWYDGDKLCLCHCSWCLSFGPSRWTNESDQRAIGFQNRKIFFRAQKSWRQFQIVDLQSHNSPTNIISVQIENEIHKSVNEIDWSVESRWNITHFPSRSGLVQTQLNFQPKSMYKSSSTTWTIFPEMIFPFGSPNCLEKLCQMNEIGSQLERTYVNEFGFPQESAERKIFHYGFHFLLWFCIFLERLCKST